MSNNNVTPNGVGGNPTRQEFHTHDIEPGAVYRGSNGQVREVVTVDGQKIQYRVLEEGRKYTKAAPKFGDLIDSATWLFASWAKEEVA